MKIIRIRNYSSHWPMLIAMAQVLKLQNVIETGSGVYSTKLFLDRLWFKDLVCLCSVENNSEWYWRIRGEIADQRHHYILSEGSVAETVAKIDLMDYDLIFIDDSKTGKERIDTIEAIISRKPRRPLVIHDFQYKGYQRAVQNHFENQVVYDKVPAAHCGLLWDGDVISQEDALRITTIMNSMDVEMS